MLHIAGLNSSSDGDDSLCYAWLSLNQNLELFQAPAAGMASMFGFNISTLYFNGKSTDGFPRHQTNLWIPVPQNAQVCMCFNVGANVGSGTAYAEGIVYVAMP